VSSASPFSLDILLLNVSKLSIRAQHLIINASLLDVDHGRQSPKKLTLYRITLFRISYVEAY
jgi:hypothetical protein